MDRAYSYLLESEHFPQNKIAFIVGPRQVGKTIISRHLQKQRKSEDLYRNWDDLEWRRELSHKPYKFLDDYRPTKNSKKPLTVLDEIHKFPRWKRYIKGLWDTRKNRLDLLVTGSGRLDVYQKGGDSLLGRYHQYRLHPFTLKEVMDPIISLKHCNPDQILKKLSQTDTRLEQESLRIFLKLYKWGGFPEPFIKHKERTSRLWQKERRQLIIREDLRDLTRIQLLSHIESLMELIIPRAGKQLSLNSLREDLQVALDSVRLWMNCLEKLYYHYTIRPYAKKINRALTREPKLYLWDWSEIQDEGSRFENMIANHLLKWCHFTQDWGLEPLHLYYVRDKEKREVDFLITRNQNPWMLVEAKLDKTEVPQALHYLANQLGVTNKFLIVKNLKNPGMAGDVTIKNAASFLQDLPL